MNQEEFEAIVATLEQENRQMRARMERLEIENEALNMYIEDLNDKES